MYVESNFLQDNFKKYEWITIGKQQKKNYNKKNILLLLLSLLLLLNTVLIQFNFQLF